MPVLSAAVVAVVVGCSNQPVPANPTRSGRVTSSGPVAVGATQRYDDGALVIDPQPVRTVPISLTTARFDLGHNESTGHDYVEQRVIFGYVSVLPMVARLPSLLGTPVAPTHRLSWVLLYASGTGGCGNEPSARTSTSLPAGSHSIVLIIDAASGTAVHYTGIGALPCEYNVKPTLETVLQAVSVPWRDLGGTRIQVTYPACVRPGAGTPATTDNSGSLIEVLGWRAIGPCQEAGTMSPMTIGFSRPWRHGPTGPVPSGYALL